MDTFVVSVEIAEPGLLRFADGSPGAEQLAGGIGERVASLHRSADTIVAAIARARGWPPTVSAILDLAERRSR